MGDHDNPATCLSSSDHSMHVRDVFLHYSGCLKDKEREEYFTTLPEHKQNRIRAEEARILSLRAIFEHDSETQGLVAKLRSDLTEFFASPPKKLKLPAPTPLTKENGFGMSAYMVFFRGSEPYKDPDFPDNFPNQKIPIETLLYQRNPDLNPLARPCRKDKDEIRYFHLPGNNMDWCEEAIARYYNEDRPEYDGFFLRPEHRTKTYMMLRPEFWRGQQHGGRNDAVHCRHMRPRCDIVSTDPTNLEVAPRNLVLYMPYLHWETDRRRAKFDEFMQKINEKHEKEKHQTKLNNVKKLKQEVRHRMNAAEMRLEARKHASGNSIENNAESDSSIKSLWKSLQNWRKPPDPQEKPHERTSFRITNTPTEVFQELFMHETQNHPESKFSKSKAAKHLTQGMLCPTSSIGKILYHAARLSESMDFYHEHAVLKEYLHHNPPLHPRRTLDQTYYSTRKSTKKRDRDQVVYRGTIPEKAMHPGTNCKPGCEDCRRVIRKVPRLIMVDQLWMWILDGNTIITSFPKRYGRNKPDPSAVHKSIRLRLKVCRKDEIRSAFDLAMIIIDQCSRMFFEPVKTGDRQPQVMDLFGSAIGNVAYNKTIAYEHFWATTEETSKIYQSQGLVDDTEDKAKSLLDINPEGVLLREIKDVVDELDIMLSIKQKQERVFKQFRKHLESLVAPGLASSKHLGTLEQKRVTEDLSTSRLSTSENSADEKNARQAVEDKKERDARWTLGLLLDISNNLEDRITDLRNLRGSAEHTEKGLNDLLALKQQQAGVVQARKAVQQTEETLKQGRSIMLFTVVTIIFLPLSFGASIFGMNTIEYNSGPWTLKREIIYMFSVSIGIILTSLILAFSTFIRALLSFIFELSWTKFITKSRIYSLWLNVKLDSDHLTKKKKELSRRWKKEAFNEKQARKDRREKRRIKKLGESFMEEGEAEGEGEGSMMNGVRENNVNVMDIV